MTRLRLHASVLKNHTGFLILSTAAELLQVQWWRMYIEMIPSVSTQHPSQQRVHLRLQTTLSPPRCSCALQERCATTYLCNNVTERHSNCNLHNLKRRCLQPGRLLMIGCLVRAALFLLLPGSQAIYKDKTNGKAGTVEHNTSWTMATCSYCEENVFSCLRRL